MIQFSQKIKGIIKQASFNKLLLCAITIIFCSHLGMDAQIDCRQIIVDYNKQLDEYKSVPENTVMYMKFDIKNIAADPDQNMESFNGIVTYRTTDALYYKTGMAMYYVDEEDAFLVNHLDKTIEWNEGGINEDTDQYNSRLDEIQKAVIENAVVSCDTMHNEKKEIVNIKVKVPDELISAINIKELNYEYNRVTKTMASISLVYYKSNLLKEQKYIFHVIDYNHKEFIPKKVRKYFVTSEGKLLSRYASYRLIKNKTE